MIPLRDVRAGTSVSGIDPADVSVRVVGVARYSDRAIQVAYEDSSGTVGSRLVYGHEEPLLEAQIPDGAPEGVQRAVSGDVRVPKFGSYGFERD